MGTPKILYKNNTEFIYSESSGINHTYFGKMYGANCGLVLNSHKIEMGFSREIIEPKGNHIKQGAWECAPASLAMLLKIPLNEVLKALYSLGWENNESGTSINLLKQATLLLINKDLIQDKSDSALPSILTVPSLNVIGKYHSVCWDGEEILDPNFGLEGRKHYSPLWTVDSLLRTSIKLLIKIN